MAELELISDEGFVKCSECDMVYQVVWNRNPVYDQIAHCPFCGDEIEEPTE